MCKFVCEVECPAEFSRDLDIPAGSFDTGKSIQDFTETGSQRVGISARSGQQRAYAAPILVKQGHHQVGWLNELMVTADRQTLRVSQRHLKLCRQFVHPHDRLTPKSTAHDVPDSPGNAKSFYLLNMGVN